MIKKEPAEINPMEQLAKESEAALLPVPEPPLSEKTIERVEQARENIAKGEYYTEEQAKKIISPKENKGMRWVVGEVATSTEKVIHDKETQMNYDIYQAIALILNKAYEE